MIRFASVARLPSISASCSISALDLKQKIRKNYISSFRKSNRSEIRKILKDAQKFKKKKNLAIIFLFQGESFSNSCPSAKLLSE